MLMCSVKTVGGLTRGSGMDEAQRAPWILYRPACSEINYKMQELTGQKCESSEQHKESGESRKSRDNDGCLHFSWIKTHLWPFMAEESLRRIASGVVAGERVNVDRAHEVGMKIVRDMEGKNVEDFKFSKKAQIITMNDSASVQVGGDELQIDPQLLFQRLIVAAQ
ncbi:hypothetical protein MAR_017111 [Mya arenaria]|uniref:Uncharacterized protein n=1 Tax=Mya arenaria TaxID=6604 RepID=A0ABY7EAW7_MYAAR|nr:hypothetical protein MAR_017111 [Mya arenaria]